jgi:hypothetical protein
VLLNGSEVLMSDPLLLLPAQMRRPKPFFPRSQVIAAAVTFWLGE